MSTVQEMEFGLAGGQKAKAALALPATGATGTGATGLPGVVVIHEIFGLNDDIRGIARRLADNGYAALAPDLYSAGPRPLCVARTVADLIGGGTGTLDTVEGARQALAARPEVDPRRTGVIGFCMGGAFALGFAARGTSRAAAVNYGQVPKERSKVEGVCPIVASYGALDRPLAGHPDRLDAWLTELGVPHDVKTYEGVGHSFMNRPSGVGALIARLPNPMGVGYGEAQAEDAWRRILAFFGEHLV